MVGLAFEVHDSWKNEQQLEQSDQDDSEGLRRQINYQNINPTFTDMFFYSFCYIGLLTGEVLGIHSCINSEDFFSTLPRCKLRGTPSTTYGGDEFRIKVIGEEQWRRLVKNIGGVATKILVVNRWQ